MRNSIVKCRKCGKLVNIKLPKFANGRAKKQNWGNNLSLTGRNLTHDVFQNIFKCWGCGGKYR